MTHRMAALVAAIRSSLATTIMVRLERPTSVSGVRQAAPVFSSPALSTFSDWNSLDVSTRAWFAVTWLPPALDPQLRELRERRVDLLLMRSSEAHTEDDLEAELLFHDAIRVVAGKRNKWQRRWKIDLSEFVDEPWIVTPPGSQPLMLLVEATRAVVRRARATR